MTHLIIVPFYNVIRILKMHYITLTLYDSTRYAFSWTFLGKITYIDQITDNKISILSVSVYQITAFASFVFR